MAVRRSRQAEGGWAAGPPDRAACCLRRDAVLIESGGVREMPPLPPQKSGTGPAGCVPFFSLSFKVTVKSSE